jgi:hypothetical protein
VVVRSPVITSHAKATVVAKEHFRFQVSASGYPAPIFSEVGALPKGVTLSKSGLLSGTPAAAGTYPITIRATNASEAARQSFTLRVMVHG